MDRDDLDVILLLVIGQRHIERPARLDFGHQQEFRKGFGVQVLLDYAAVTDDILRLLPGDAAGGPHRSWRAFGGPTFANVVPPPLIFKWSGAPIRRRMLAIGR
jgi:hypothetical protein